MSTTGVVSDVTPVFGGGTLAAAVGATDDVLLLDDAGDFAEDFSEERWLVVGSDLTPRRYVAVQNDEDSQESVTLAAGLPTGVSFEADLPVVPWDPAAEAEDKRMVEFKATVRLDGTDGAISATVPHHLIPLAGVTALSGASVRLVESGGEWSVDYVFGREPVLDSSSLTSPSAEIALTADSANIPDGEWTRVEWDTSSSPWPYPYFGRPVFGGGAWAGTLEASRSGRYLVIGTAVFIANSSGIRRARLVLVHADGTTEVLRNVTTAPTAAAKAAFQAIRSVYLEAGQSVGMDVVQTSGAGLPLSGAETGAKTALELAWDSSR